MMRSTAIIVLAVLFLAAGGAAVLGQQAPGGGTGPAGPGGAGKEFAPEKFPEFKARVLKMLDERKARLEQEKACVEKAANHEELRKCRPEPPAGRGGHGGQSMGAPGQRQPQHPGPEGVR